MAEVVANCDHLAQLRLSPSLPYAFTELGAIMLASVLNCRIVVFDAIRELIVEEQQPRRRIGFRAESMG